MVRSLLLLTILSLTTGLSVARRCQNITIPISISSRNGIFSLATPANDVDVTDFVLNNFRAGVNYTDDVLQGYKTIQANYNLAATYCTPESGHGKSLQVLTHGVGINRYYWDFSYNNYNYSYVDRALAQGYSTLIYDRLGIGESSRGDPIQELQASLEVSALHQLTKMLRQSKPIPIGEILTIGSPQEVSNPFKGPVLVIDGDRDLIFCGGNCSSSTPSAAELVRPKFTKVTDFEAVIVPQTGHLLNFPSYYI
ncbi:hypothetical protein E5D57_012759 [Metarhizium anisopliae]|nr:hypothetical protein E5D57_012759 [Metarhizium anisopliae]